MVPFDCAQEFPANLLSAPEKQCMDLVLLLISHRQPHFSAPVPPYTVDGGRVSLLPCLGRRVFKLVTLCWNFNHFSSQMHTFKWFLMNSFLIAKNAK